MNLLEYEAKYIFRQFGISTPRGLVFHDKERIEGSLGNLRFPIMVKAQIGGGGRGKAGGVITALRRQDALESCERLLGSRVAGLPVHAVLLEEMIDSTQEIILAITIDQRTRCPVLLAGCAGGMDVENMPNDTIRQWTIDPLGSVPSSVIDDAAHFLTRNGAGMGEVRSVISSMWRLFHSMDCELVEINPLMITASGKALAADAKLVVDDFALFRHQRIASKASRDLGYLEIMARNRGLTMVELPGNIGVIANGAGLTMAVLDTIQRLGGQGGTFLDLGGTDDPEKISEALGFLSYEMAIGKISSMLVCIFGGITNCETVADALMMTVKDREVKSRTVVRLRGNGEDDAFKMLRLAGFNVQLDLEEACSEAIEVIE